MTRRPKVWLVVAVLFTVVNIGAAVYAAAMGEALHAGGHVALTLLGAGAVWWLARRTAARDDATPVTDDATELTDRLTQLEQSVDAVAIEVERVGEGQRFMTRVLAEQEAAAPVGERAPEPIELAARKASPPLRRD